MVKQEENIHDMNGQKTAGKTKDSAQNHIRQVVNPQIEPGEAD